MTSVEVREQLVRALQLDLVGPDGHVGNPAEILPQAPSRWYLIGFLVPVDTPEEQRADENVSEELDASGEGGDTDEGSTHEGSSSKKTYYPSSCGMSLLVASGVRKLHVVVKWGQYKLEPIEGKEMGGNWHRKGRECRMEVDVPNGASRPLRKPVPDSGGLEVVVTTRPVSFSGQEGGLPAGTRSVSVFLVNKRTPAPDSRRDEGFVFQTVLRVECQEGLLPRPNLRGLQSGDWDERVADLQFRDAQDFAVGHNVSVCAEKTSTGTCHAVNTSWIPSHQVEKVAPAELKGVELGMDELAGLADSKAARQALVGMVTQYEAWIDSQGQAVPSAPRQRLETGQELLGRAKTVARRIAAGIKLLEDPQCLEAFRIANRAMALSARRRQGVMQGKLMSAVKPGWRPFQLAFILMNLKGIACPTDYDRGVVDLLFFPTGGGKTEAYLGLAAFTLVLRRLRDPGIGSSGVSVLMRYTLRLLTLDQLGRAATLICALEEERCQDEAKLGSWPFEIGLWVGRAATPNRMGAKNDNNPDTARAKTIAHWNHPKTKPSPVPIEDCPWCGCKFEPGSFVLKPTRDNPTNLLLSCADRDCAFSQGRYLPILTVDEAIYQRLPCFMIATVDKFAAMPWTGEVGGFFGKVQKYDKEGFYGPCSPGPGRALPKDSLPPPDLIIQDELHLISGPLGTMVGLYESALDELASVTVDGTKVGPKIVASTATVRRAENQIRSLFNRCVVDVFPPPGPDRRDSFFAVTKRPEESNARLYLGVPSMGKGGKQVQLRVYLILLAAAKRYFDLPENLAEPRNPADPYMTLLGYFNSLRELGGTRRQIEDEVWNIIRAYGKRQRVGEPESAFSDRQISYEPVELTSRISTGKVSEYKRQLALEFSNPQKSKGGKGSKKGESKQEKPVDIAIATNMISVGLDITRLGLMVVYGQPKTSAEYIQATSRVGRDDSRPGLVITILNMKKMRDRSHYERFNSYHESFYRNVEATSVTPFSPRALDRGLAGVVVALARLGLSAMTPADQASAIREKRPQLQWVIDLLADRAVSCCGLTDRQAQDEVRDTVRARVTELLESWNKDAAKLAKDGMFLQYQTEKTGGMFRRLLYEFLNPELQGMSPGSLAMKFRANRSMRDVEPRVNLIVHRMNGGRIEEEEEAND